MVLATPQDLAVGIAPTEVTSTVTSLLLKRWNLGWLRHIDAFGKVVSFEHD